MIVNQQNCTGCTACGEICPKKCITLDKNDEGFIIPIVNKDECINCGLCDKVCMAKNIEYEAETNEVYAFKNKSVDIRKSSTSGGFFSTLSDWILNQNGVIYGAVFDENFIVKHICATNEKNRNKMRTSKYVQSDIRGIFSSIYNGLILNKIVLFSGTPCQIAGLIRFLKLKKCDTSKLITCDFVCHGTSSPLIWEEYLNYIRAKYHDNITEINFRDKTYGWHKPVLKINLENSMQALDEKKDPFYLLFYSNCILRTSCYFCKFSKTTRVSDITMGDCWGIDSMKPELDDDNGISLLLINTDKGKKIFNNIVKKDEIIKISYEDIRQPHLYAPVQMPKNRKKFWQDYYKKGFLYVLRHYTNYSYYNKVKNEIKGLIKKVIK